jgi:hypothetical protein
LNLTRRTKTDESALCQRTGFYTSQRALQRPEAAPPFFSVKIRLKISKKDEKDDISSSCKDLQAQNAFAQE